MKRYIKVQRSHAYLSKKKIIIACTVLVLCGNSIFTFNNVWHKNNQSGAVQNSISDIKKVSSEEDAAAVSASKVEKLEKNNKSASNLESKDFKSWNDSCDPNLVVVNNENSISENFKANIVNFKDVKINSAMKENLEKMINDASFDGVSLWVSSGYRSVERQTMLYNKKVESYEKKGLSLSESEKLAANVVARPGKSEHHTGLAVDFNGVRDDFFKTKEYAWLIKNSADYGFILRYKKEKIGVTNVIFEPWHFRFVGVEHAKAINEKNLCLEEYINFLNK